MTFARYLALSWLTIAACQSFADTQSRPTTTLFANVQVFDGINDTLSAVDVLVVDNKIERVAADITPPEGATLVDGGGRTLMPGLIDSHVHLNGYKDGNIITWQNTTWEEIGARAAAMAGEMLAMGFTTVRDMCGAHEGLKLVVDEGLLPGPRIYLAGACLGQTSGHGDWGIAGQRKGESNLERLEITRIVDGVDEMLQGGRRNFALGAHYLKVMVSGGVTSIKDPIYASQLTDD